ncbi:GNAT family N-acetyltransferase [Agrilactobacillus yilanensis]|uniref:GNAT family N-acetyltransferase n=1 Tax=Agrilactobacillus yilanensis TaxID=2485997 RepID=A0ABW4J7Q6_9LACO|nr:GNAT family N-acetyltransferase [Agrilactobacillus yilanensis]
MQPFEKYHPIMTSHYTLDWLTSFTVKEVHQLRQNQVLAKAARRTFDTDLTQTVRYINQAMRAVMGNQALIWGIQTRQQPNFLGIFQFRNFNLLDKSAEIRFELLPAHQHQGILGEVLNHMSQFAFDELDLKRLKAITYQDQTAAKTLLTQSGFQFCENLTVLSQDQQKQGAKLAVYNRTVPES